VETHYSLGYLIAAEILYDRSGLGDGNNLRVLFIHSDNYYDSSRENEVRPKLTATVNSGKYSIVKVQTAYANDYLVAAEVYYRVVK
jgi:hypothetical protein